MSDGHVRPAGESEEPLYDVNVRTPTHAERARTLAATFGTATLCTIARDPAGFPYGSLVTFALDGPDPIFLISELAEHTRNLRTDSRCSLLIAEGGKEDPLANARLTLLGRCATVHGEEERERAKHAFCTRHPTAGYYVDYKDFSFWKLGVEAVRYIGGYGRMSWVAVEEWRASEPDPIAPHGDAILRHMNQDHPAVMADCCRAFTKATDVTAATMTAVDRYGFEISVQTRKGPRPIRLGFAQPIASPADARRELVAMATRARESLGRSEDHRG